MKNLLAKTIVVAASNVAKLLEGRKAKIMVEVTSWPGSATDHEWFGDLFPQGLVCIQGCSMLTTSIHPRLQNAQRWRDHKLKPAAGKFGEDDVLP